MKRHLALLLVVLAVCAVLGRGLQSPSRRVSHLEQLGLGGVRPGDSYEDVTRRFGRPGGWDLGNATWKVTCCGPFQELYFVKQPEENDYWVVGYLAGAPVTQGDTPVVQKGDSQEDVYERLGEPGTRGADRWSWKLSPSAPYRAWGREGTPLLNVLWKDGVVANLWISSK